jgi:hypothetical protein
LQPPWWRHWRGCANRDQAAAVRARLARGRLLEGGRLGLTRPFRTIHPDDARALGVGPAAHDWTVGVSLDLMADRAEQEARESSPSAATHHDEGRRSPRRRLQPGPAVPRRGCSRPEMRRVARQPLVRRGPRRRSARSRRTWRHLEGKRRRRSSQTRGPRRGSCYGGRPPTPPSAPLRDWLAIHRHQRCSAGNHDLPPR